MTVNRFDKANFKTTIKTDEGYLKSESIVTRTGVFLYQNADGTVRRELRHPDDVFEYDSLESLKLKPVTDDHPTQKIVNSENFKEIAVGYTGESVNTDGSYILANFVITDPKTIQAIEGGKKRELSLGYTVELEREDGEYNGQRYTHRQKNIRYNHLAVVERGRAGSVARIHLDSNDAFLIDHEHKEVVMENNLKTITLDGIDYKAAPEVMNAFTKIKNDFNDLTTKFDSQSNDFKKLEAERDALKVKVDELESINHDALINQAIEERMVALDSAKKILGDASKIDVKMDTNEIYKAVISQKMPDVNLDEKDSYYLKAAFDVLKAQCDKQPSEAFQKQKDALKPRGDAKEEEEYMDADEARKRMMSRRMNAYKKDKNKKDRG